MVLGSEAMFSNFLLQSWEVSVQISIPLLLSAHNIDVSDYIDGFRYLQDLHSDSDDIL